MITDDAEQLDRWMQQSAKGDGEAFGLVADAVQDRLYRLAMANGLDHQDAADAVQEALARAFVKRKRYRPDGNASAWLGGFVMNVIREMRRRRKSSNIDLAAMTASEKADHDQRDRLRALTSALDVLPDRQREAVACRYLQRMSVSETAAVMGCAEGTVKATTSAGLTTLRRLLKVYQ